MILDTPNALPSDGVYGRATLDDLFRRAALRDVEAIALIDPPHRTSFMDGAPRRLTWAQADRAISAMARTLRQLGLPSDAVVAVQLPNAIESIIALLGVIRAGMIAAPLPLLWRRRDIVTALKPVGVKAIITASRIGSTMHAELAMAAAAELFPVRYVCAFGDNLPDGTVPLDAVFEASAAFESPPARLEQPAAHIAVVTFDESADGIRPAARNHHALIAGGVTTYLETGAPLDGQWLSTIPASSFAGLSLTLLPWLLGGGTLSLHHGFDPEAFAAQMAAQPSGKIIVPGPALPLLDEAGCVSTAETIMALWRAPERVATAPRWRRDAILIDVAAFGELGLTAARRDSDGLPSPIPLDLLEAPSRSMSGIAVLETGRSANGTLALRGLMVPALSLGAERDFGTRLEHDAAGFTDTGIPCRLDGDGKTVTITAPAPGTNAIGGYRLRPRDIDRAVCDIDPDATIVALPDALLGERLAGLARDPHQMAAQLHAQALNPLLAAAFQPRQLGNGA